MKKPKITITGENGNIYYLTSESKDDAGNVYEYVYGSEDGRTIRIPTHSTAAEADTPPKVPKGTPLIF